MDAKTALIICAVIGGIFAVILIIAGIGSVGSSTGHFVKDISNGTPLEQPAASLEKAGDDLTASAIRVFMEFTGLLALIGLVWFGSKS
jgi:hypothetical protein